MPPPSPLTDGPGPRTGLLDHPAYPIYPSTYAQGSSTILREADLGALTYSGLQPLADALGPAIEQAATRQVSQ